MRTVLLTITAFAAAALSALGTPILPGLETPLQQIINDRVFNHTAINVNSNQVANDAYWQVSTPSTLNSYLLIEIAGYAGSNAFGIYNQLNPIQRLEVFSGGDSAPNTELSVAVPTGWSSFGFYLSNTPQNFTWFSDSSLNAGGQLDHFVAFQGQAGSWLNAGTTTQKWVAFDADDYVIAIEDLNLGDQDYNDMVVLVQNVRAAPSPPPETVPDAGATILLLGASMGGVLALRSWFTDSPSI